jgi:Zn-dependent M28 family amino/carboxypeptidase
VIARDPRWPATRSALAAGLMGALAIVVASCSAPTGHPPLEVDPAVVRAHLTTLTSAEGLGEEPGSPGEVGAMKYAADIFRANHLITSTQSVPLYRIRSQPVAATVTTRSGKQTLGGGEYVAWTPLPQPAVAIDAPIVFVGFGIVAPEFKWDDYKDVDVAGKVVLLLESSPHNGNRDEFGTLGETYYSRSTYKFEEAARHGAAGVFIVHASATAIAEWDALVAAVSGVRIASDPRVPGSAPEATVEGWLTGAAAATLAGSAGADLEQLKELALEHNFQPVTLDARASVAIASTVTPVASQNVIGVVEGQTSEYVLIGSRWNRIGEMGGAGAVRATQVDDDASGVAVLLETAAAFARKPKPRRTLVFMVTTAERRGLVGSRFYAEHPVFAPDKTTAEIFFDRASFFSGGRHVRIIGHPFQGLSDLLKNVGTAHGRLMENEHDTDKLFYYRWSQAAYAEQGIPEMTFSTAFARPGAPPTRRAAPLNVLVPPFDPQAAIDDTDLLYNLISRVSDSTDWPALRKPGVE